jgi:hypothetical protein
MPAVKVTVQQLWDFLYLGLDGNFDSYLSEKESRLEEPLLDSTLFAAITAANIDVIVVGQEMSEDGIGGDYLVDLCNGVMKAIKSGYTIFSWYGPASEVIIVGYIPDELTISQEGQEG